MVSNSCVLLAIPSELRFPMQIPSETTFLAQMHPYVAMRNHGERDAREEVCKMCNRASRLKVLEPYLELVPDCPRTTIALVREPHTHGVLSEFFVDEREKQISPHCAEVPWKESVARAQIAPVRVALVLPGGLDAESKDGESVDGAPGRNGLREYERVGAAKDTIGLRNVVVVPPKVLHRVEAPERDHRVPVVGFRVRVRIPRPSRRER